MENNEITRTNASTGVSSYRVSNQTAALIDRLKEAYTLSGKITDDVEAIYGAGVSHVMRPFDEKFSDMVAELEKLVMCSVFENISQLGNEDLI